VAETVATGSATVSGLTGHARFSIDLRRGRYAERFAIPVMGTSAEVYDGVVAWGQDISGGVHPYDAWFSRERARTDGFVKSQGYLDGRAGASYRCVAIRDEDGQQVVVVRVTPRGGIAAELAFDTRTHLLARISERLPTTTRVTRFSDYRTVGGAVLPFFISEGTALEPADGFSFKIAQYELSSKVAPADFRRPAADKNASISDGKTSVTVPLKVEGRQLLVWASINGRRAMPFILDTGGHAILTTGAATQLGLRTSGAGESGGSGAGTIGLQYARVRSIQLKGARLSDQPMLVIPYPYQFYERGRRQPLAGILGLEIFEHFATRIDYGKQVLTLSLLSKHAHNVRGTAVPFRFQDDMPLVYAAADKHAGLFGADTGNAGTAILFGAFLKRTGLDEKYHKGTVVIGHGTGGSNTGRLETLGAFSIGGKAIRNVPADFTNMERGSFSSWTEAGNIGYEVFSRFTPTFDYAAETLYLDRCTHHCIPLRNTTGMSFSKDVATSFLVTSVSANTPAARAGIAAGDRILAVNGRPAADLSRADLWDVVSRRAGRLDMTVQRGAYARSRIMTWANPRKRHL
jgi:hypothetical protein